MTPRPVTPGYARALLDLDIVRTMDADAARDAAEALASAVVAQGEELATLRALLAALREEHLRAAVSR